MKTLMKTRPNATLASLILGLTAVPFAIAADLQVPAGHPTIQAAVDAASNGDTIRIAAGVYSGQVLISNKSLTLAGSSGAVLRATAGMSQSYLALGSSQVPLLGILRSEVVVSNLTFEGQRLADSQASDFIGIYYFGSGGRVEDCRIIGFRGSTLGRGLGYGLRVLNPVNLGTGAVSIHVFRSTFADNWSSVVPGAGVFDPTLIRTIFVVNDNTITGNGPDDTGVQRGIQILTGATGEVSRNIISDHAYVGTNSPTSYSIGVEAYDGLNFGEGPLNALQPIRFEGNVFRNNQLHLLVLRGNGSTIVDNTFGETAPGRRPMGLGISGENLLVAGNRFSNLPQSIVLFGNDPEFGTNLGITRNAQLSSNRFCNVTTNVWVEPLATATEQGTLTCPFPVEFTSILSTTNGVRMAWTDPGPGHAYTVQVRESLTSGGWRNAPTRYRWPWPFTNWGDAPINLPAARYYRVLAEPAATPDRGRLLNSSLRGRYDVNTQNSVYATWGIASFARAKFGIVSRAFTYETVDPSGLPITASALLILPIGTNGPLPFASVQHGTTALKSAAPSQPNSGERWASVLGSYGYAVVVPDYLGLGTSPGYQAYLHARSEATCVVDALRAGKSLCASNNVTLNGQLFLAGFSQGGHVTMAAHRELEAFHTNEFTVTASAPCAGTYDLGGVTFEANANPNYPIGYPFAMILAAYLPIYQLADTLEDLLAEPYRRTLPPLLDGAHNEGQIEAVLPRDHFTILRPDFQADFRANVSNPLRQALLDNNTHSWTPKAPMKLIHCQGDSIAAFANVEVAYQSFSNRGACCVNLVDPGAPARLDHETCYNPSLREVLAWFETLRQ